MVALYMYEPNNFIQLIGSPLKGVIANFGSLILLVVLGAHIATGDAELEMESNKRVGSLSIWYLANCMTVLR